MAVTEANLLRKIKGANVYAGCTLPNAFSAPTLTAGTPAGGTDVGATVGPTTFAYNASIELVEIEQASGRVAPHVVEETVQMTFTVGEVTAVNLKTALSQTFAHTDGDFSVFTLGGYIDVTGQCVACVAEKANLPGNYYGAMIYNAFIASEASIPHKRGEVQTIEVTLGGSALLTRDEGDQLGQYFDEA